MTLASVNNEIVPGLPALAAAAARQQRLTHRLQASYVLVLLLAPAVRLLPWPSGFDSVVDRLTATLLIAVVVVRLVLRRVGADSDWVQARRKAEEERSAAWLRAVTGTVAPDDSMLVRDIAGRSLEDRWTIYRAHRIDHQIDFFTRRAREHAKASRRWLLMRLLLTVATLGLAIMTLLWPAVLPNGMTGLFSAALVSVEAWIQFRRNAVIAESYRSAREELASLRTRDPQDEAALAATARAVELALEHERWTWTAIMSVAVLTSARRTGRTGP